MTVSEIIDRLGGTSKVADYTGWPYTTVDSWRSNRHVPEWRKAALLRMAVEFNVPLSTADFPPRPEKAA